MHSVFEEKLHGASVEVRRDGTEIGEWLDDNDVPDVAFRFFFNSTTWRMTYVFEDENVALSFKLRFG